MIVAIISAIMQGFAEIFWKKSLGFGVGGKMHDLLGYPLGLMIIVYFFITGINFDSLDLVLFISSVLILIIAVFKNALYQKIYRQEKISILMPYTNVNKILTIVLSFFIFADVSFISLMITILAIIVVILFSIDFKTLKLPSSISLILFGETVLGLLSVWIGWIILNYGISLYFTIFLFTGILFLSFLVYKNGELKTLKNVDRKFYLNRVIGSIGWVSWFLSLVVIGNLGLSIGILLSFFGIGITLFLSFIFLGDKPSKKDLLLTFIVSSLVGLGFLLK